MGHSGFQAFSGAITANAESGPVDTQGLSIVTVMGNVNGIATISVLLTEDGTNYYHDSAQDVTTAANTDFVKTFTTGARGVKVKCSAAVTGNVFIAANSN